MSPLSDATLSGAAKADTILANASWSSPAIAAFEDFYASASNPSNGLLSSLPVRAVKLLATLNAFCCLNKYSPRVVSELDVSSTARAI